jgi:cytochrome c oxidase assembly factor CtaG
VIPDRWNLDPVPLAAAAVALVLYTGAFRKLRARGRPDHATIVNAALFAAGVAAGILALISPLDAVAEETLVSAHMAQHLLIGDVAPLLLLLGLRGPIAFFLLPPVLLQPLARARVLRQVLAFVLRPRVSFGIWAAALAVWHIPVVYDAALSHSALHQLEHASLFVGGLLLWSQIIDPAQRRRLTAGRRAAFAALALVAGMGLTETLLASAPLYPHYAGAVDRPFGLTLETDQTWAGVVMTIEQVATLGIAAALLFRHHVERLSEDDAHGERRRATLADEAP